MMKYIAIFIGVLAVFISEDSYAQRGRPAYRPPLISASATTDPVGQVHDIFVTVTGSSSASVELLMPGIDGNQSKNEYKGSFDAAKNKITVELPADQEIKSGLVEIYLARSGRGYFIESFQKKTTGWREYFDIYRFNREGIVINSNSISRSLAPDSPAFFDNKSQYVYQNIGGKYFVSMSIILQTSEENTNKLYRLTRTFYSYDKSGKMTVNTSAGYSDSNGYLSSTAAYSKFDSSAFTLTTASDIEYGQAAKVHFTFASQLAATKNPDIMNRIMDSADVSYYSDDSYDIFKIKFTIGYQLEKYRNRIIPRAKIVRVGISRNELYIVNGSPDILGSERGDIKDILVSWPYPAYYMNILRSYQLPYLMILGFYEDKFGLVFLDLQDPEGDSIHILDFPRENKVTLSGQKFLLTLGSDGIISFTKEQ